MTTENRDLPGVIAPPPLIYVGFIAAGLVLNALYPLPFLPKAVTLITGIALSIFGAFIIAQAFRAMGRADTPVDPYEASRAIVTDGPYRFTRNPIYVGFALIYLGLACLDNSLWAVWLWPVALLVIDRGVIAREERYLESKFGEAYRQYKAKVRRWV